MKAFVPNTLLSFLHLKIINDSVDENALSNTFILRMNEMTVYTVQVVTCGDEHKDNCHLTLQFLCSTKCFSLLFWFYGPHRYSFGSLSPLSLTPY